MRISVQDHGEPGTVLLDRRAIEALTRGKIIDAPITRLKRDPDLWLLPTAMQQNGDVFLSHTLVRGDLADLEAAEFRVVNEQTLFEIPDHLADRNTGRHWITNLLHVDDGVLAFLHSEYTGEDDFFGMESSLIDGVETRAPGRSCISLGWISNEDLDAERIRFLYLGHIATYSSEFPHYNVSGTPVLVNECDGVEYVNILFMDVQGKAGDDGWIKDSGYVTQARAPLGQVVEQAKAGLLAPWSKRHENGWADAMGRRSIGVLPRVPGHPDKRIRTADVIVHSDLLQDPGSGRYILLAYVLRQKRRNPSSMVFYSSEDGLRWQFEGTSHERDDGEAGWSYASFFDVADGVEGSTPYVLFGWDYGKPGRCVYKLNVELNCG